jgi:preprotein translocase subunit YajC
MWLEILGISNAMAEATTAAATTAQSPKEGFLSMLPMLVIFMVVFYFLLVRPQAKRAKEQRQLMGSLAVGDEVVTSGGIMGTVTKLDETKVTVTSANTELMMQKNAIIAILPKGTLASV